MKWSIRRPSFNKSLSIERWLFLVLNRISLPSKNSTNKRQVIWLRLNRWKSKRSRNRRRRSSKDSMTNSKMIVSQLAKIELTSDRLLSKLPTKTWKCQRIDLRTPCPSTSVTNSTKMIYSSKIDQPIPTGSDEYSVNFRSIILGTFLLPIKRFISLKHVY